MSWINDIRISVKVSAVFAAICLVIGISTATIYSSISTMSSTEKMTVHTYEVLEQLNDVVGAMVNAETGVRGYLVSADTGFLAPYEGGQKQFQTASAKASADHNVRRSSHWAPHSPATTTANAQPPQPAACAEGAKSSSKRSKAGKIRPVSADALQACAASLGVNSCAAAGSAA